MEKTFGPTIYGLITDNIGPERRLLWDSKARKGRPDTMKILEEVYKAWGAEGEQTSLIELIYQTANFFVSVIFITSNWDGNQEIMEGCKERGMHAFGTLWDF